MFMYEQRISLFIQFFGYIICYREQQSFMCALHRRYFGNTSGRLTVEAAARMIAPLVDCAVFTDGIVDGASIFYNFSFFGIDARKDAAHFIFGIVHKLDARV